MRTSRWTPASAESRPKANSPDTGDGRALQPGFVARLVIDHLALEASALDPAEIHAQEHLGPVLRFGAPGARVNRDDGVLAIVFAAEHLLDFAAFDETGELVDALRQLRSDIFALTGPIDEHAEVVCFGSERGDQLDFFLDAAAPLEGLLRLDLVVPEIGRGCAGFYLGKLVARACALQR